MAQDDMGTQEGPGPRADDREAGDERPVVTYEAADRGSVCCLGCQAGAMILAGVALGVWYLFAGQLWRGIVGLILLIGGIALARYISSGRNRWEVSFDRERRVVTLLSQVSGTREVRTIPFDEIEAVVLQEITRDVTTGDAVPHYLPVFRLQSGERVPLDRRQSIKDRDRARETADEMRALLGLDSGQSSAE